MLKLIDILKASRNQQITNCKTKLDDCIEKWEKEHNNRYHSKLDELNKELNELYHKLERIKKDMIINHKVLIESLENKIEIISAKYHKFIEQYNEHKRLKYDSHNKILQTLRDIDQNNFDIFQREIKERELNLTDLREKYSMLKPHRIKSEEILRVTIEKKLISVYKSIENEDYKRKETTDELFQQIQHYTKRIKSCIGNM